MAGWPQLMSVRLTTDVPVIPSLLPHLTPSALHFPLLFGSGNTPPGSPPPWAWTDITATLFHRPEARAELKLGSGLEWEKHTCPNSDTLRYCGATTTTFVSHLNLSLSLSLSLSHLCLPFSTRHFWALPPSLAIYGPFYLSPAFRISPTSALSLILNFSVSLVQSISSELLICFFSQRCIFSLPLRTPLIFSPPSPSLSLYSAW